MGYGVCYREARSIPRLEGERLRPERRFGGSERSEQGEHRASGHFFTEYGEGFYLKCLMIFA